MKKILIFALGLSVLSLGFGLAKHHKNQDVYVKLDSPTLLDPLSPTVSDTGDSLYDAQEGTHDAVTETTGEEIDHYYVWVCVGDACVPVDPFTVNR